VPNFEAMIQKQVPNFEAMIQKRDGLSVKFKLAKEVPPNCCIPVRDYCTRFSGEIFWRFLALLEKDKFDLKN